MPSNVVPYEGLVIPPRGPMTLVTVRSIEEKAAHLECRTFDCIAVSRILDDGPTHFDVWVDDEGLYAETPELNSRASLIAGQSIVGTVMVTDGPNANGDTRSITEQQIEFCRIVDSMVVTAQSPVVASAMRVATPSQEDS